MSYSSMVISVQSQNIITEKRSDDFLAMKFRYFTNLQRVLKRH